MGVLPDMGAGARAATGAAFPCPKAAIGEAVAAACRQGGNIEEGAVERTKWEVESYDVSRQRRVALASLSKFVAISATTALAESNLLA